MFHTLVNLAPFNFTQWFEGNNQVLFYYVFHFHFLVTVWKSSCDHKGQSQMMFTKHPRYWVKQCKTRSAANYSASLTMSTPRTIFLIKLLASCAVIKFFMSIKDNKADKRHGMNVNFVINGIFKLERMMSYLKTGFTSSWRHRRCGLACRWSWCADRGHGHPSSDAGLGEPWSSSDARDPHGACCPKS